MEAGEKRRGGFGRRACKAELEFLQAITGRARHQGILPSSSSLIWSRIARSEPRAFDIGSPGCDRWREETQGRGELLHSVLQVRKKKIKTSAPSHLTSQLTNRLATSSLSSVHEEKRRLGTVGTFSSSVLLLLLSSSPTTTSEGRRLFRRYDLAIAAYCTQGFRAASKPVLGHRRRVG